MESVNCFADYIILRNRTEYSAVRRMIAVIAHEEYFSLRHIVFKDFLEYLHDDFDPKRCNILVSISIHNMDTLVDFIQYDTLYKDKLEIFPIVGSFKSANGITIQFADKGCLTRGVLYETQQVCHILPICYFHSLIRPMVLRNGKLIMNPPPLCEN